MAFHSALSFVTASTVDQHLQGVAINFGSAVDNVIVPAVTGQGIYIYKYFLVVSAAITLTFKDGVAGTALTGPISLTGNEAMVFTFDTRPWFEISLNNAFVINASNSSQVSGRCHYIQAALLGTNPQVTLTP